MYNPSLSPHDVALLAMARGRDVNLSRAAAQRSAQLGAVQEGDLQRGRRRFRWRAVQPK